jgi:hypothetical protein
MTILLVLVLAGVCVLALVLGGGGGRKTAAAPAPRQGPERVDPEEKRQALLAKNLRGAADALERVRLHVKAGDGLDFVKQPCDLALASFAFVTKTLRAGDEKRLGKGMTERLRLVVANDAVIYQELANLSEGGTASWKTPEALTHSATLLRQVADALGGVELAPKRPKATAKPAASLDAPRSP